MAGTAATSSLAQPGRSCGRVAERTFAMTEDAAARKGLSIFDNAPTGGFHVRSRGYDREQVERYVRKLEDKLREATARGAERGEQLARADERVSELSGEVTSLRDRLEAAEAKLRNVDQPSFAGLGEHVAELLASAEEQSDQLRASATAEADRLRTEARAEADRVVDEARAHATQVQQAADQYRIQTEREAAATRDHAAAEAARMRKEASSDATAARVRAVDEAKALLADTQLAAAQLRAASDADAEAQREAAATLLHEARRRADHHVGAVTAALTALQQRLEVSVPPATTSEPESEDEPTTPAEQTAVTEQAGRPGVDDETQLFPVPDRS